ncbi:hypothetical protein KY339_01735 [Candidatus Woesearchaeota archaeon]|nr:hypothetical protein [Candidatus Woesearchaeota archaeon]
MNVESMIIKATLGTVRELPLQELIETGYAEPIDIIQHELAFLEASLSIRNLFYRKKITDTRKMLLDAAKQAHKVRIDMIIEDIDPPIRGIVQRLNDLPFIRYVGNNCSGHPEKDGEGYLQLGFRLGSKENKHNIYRFSELVREIEIPSQTDDRISYFQGMRLPEKSIKPLIIWGTKISLYGQSATLTLLKGWREYRDTRKEMLHIEHPHIFGNPNTKELAQLWEKFSNVIAQFETYPVQERLTPEMFAQGMPGGSGYRGGKVMRAVCEQLKERWSSL